MLKERNYREEIDFESYGNRVKTSVPQKRISSSNSYKRYVDQDKSNFGHLTKSQQNIDNGFRVNSKSNRRSAKPKLDKIQIVRSDYSYNTNKYSANKIISGSNMIKAPIKKLKVKTREKGNRAYTQSELKDTTSQLVQNDETMIISNLSRVIKSSKLRMKGNMNSTT
jgi:hypothetical protein